MLYLHAVMTDMYMNVPMYVLSEQYIYTCSMGQSSNVEAYSAYMYYVHVMSLCVVLFVNQGSYVNSETEGHVVSWAKQG